MIKVLILVSGLAALVPDPGEDPKGLTALLAETRYSGHLQEHVPVLRQPLDKYSTRSWLIDQGHFEARFVAHDGTAIGLGAESYFPHIDQLTDVRADGKLNPDCLTLDCADGEDRSLVGAAVRFEGGWRTRPVQRCATPWILPVGAFDEKALSDYRKLSNLNVYHSDHTARALATGLALETQIDRLEELKFYVGSVLQTLQLTSAATCKEWLGSSVDKCVVIELENWPRGKVDTVCNGEDPPAHCRVDHHFEVFYDLIAKPTPVNDRWLPYVSAGEARCPNGGGPAQPPGVRCPPVWIGR
jgi:hypothetical protein